MHKQHVHAAIAISAAVAGGRIHYHHHHHTFPIQVKAELYTVRISSNPNMERTEGLRREGRRVFQLVITIIIYIYFFVSFLSSLSTCIIIQSPLLRLFLYNTWTHQ